MEKKKFVMLSHFLREDVAHAAMKAEGLERLAAIVKEEEIGGDFVGDRLQDVHDALQAAITTVAKMRGDEI